MQQRVCALHTMGTAVLSPVFVCVSQDAIVPPVMLVPRTGWRQGQRWRQDGQHGASPRPAQLD
jgi:hypothetical protein